MKVPNTSSAKRALLLAAALLACGAALSVPARRGAAQSASPVLVSQAGSTRAVALEASTRVAEPFAPNAPVRFGADGRTRVMLFAMNLHLAPGEDPASVVDPDLRVHDTPGLYVFGGAVFPTCPGVDPTLTMWALCYRVAERLVERVRRGDEQ